METIGKKRGSLKIVLIALFLLIGGIFLLGQHNANAAEIGFVKKDGYTYYVKKDGSYQTGWLTIGQKKYYFYSNGKMATGWLKNAKGEYRYFGTSTGVMFTGWIKASSTTIRYFDTTTGVMKTGWQTIGNKHYYFNKTNGKAYMGWVKYAKTGQYWYFDKKDGHSWRGWYGTGEKRRCFNTKTGLMYAGWWKGSNGDVRYFSETKGAVGYMYVGKQKIGDSYYMFNESTGKMIKGWHTDISGNKYYFDASTGVMAVGKKTIDGKECVFSLTGVFQGYVSETAAGSGSDRKTIKNLFLAAFQPIGSTVYKYGGGHDADATRVGLNPNWALSYKNRNAIYGLDCSGYVGWSVYQVMRKMSTGWSGSMPNLYKSYGWGTTYSLSQVNKKFYPGDVIANAGHIWMVLGQCSDGSVVVLHSSGDDGSGGPQISGSAGQAAALAQKYMSRYSGYSYSNYYTTYSNWLSPSSYYYYSTTVFRWNTNSLADPEGFRNMTADQILAQLSSAIGNK